MLPLIEHYKNALFLGLDRKELEEGEGFESVGQNRNNTVHVYEPNGVSVKRLMGNKTCG